MKGGNEMFPPFDSSNEKSLDNKGDDIEDLKRGRTYRIEKEGIRQLKCMEKEKGDKEQSGNSSQLQFQHFFGEKKPNLQHKVSQAAFVTNNRLTVPVITNICGCHKLQIWWSDLV